MEIEEKIEQYERETGYTIENIAVYNIDNSQIFYTDIQDMINVSAKNEKLSGLALLVFYTQRE